MRLTSYYTISDFAAVIGVSTNRVRAKIDRAYTGTLRRVGCTKLIDKAAFFHWYANGGAALLDDAFKKSVVSHDSIKREMQQYYDMFYGKGDAKRLDHVLIVGATKPNTKSSANSQ